MTSTNLFRFIADASHLASVLILIGALHHNRSAAGISLKTQLLYLAVFCTRYLDLIFWLFGKAAPAWWVIIGKLTFLSTSAYIVHLVGNVYKTTYDKWLDTLRMRYIVPPCFVLAMYSFFVTYSPSKASFFFRFAYQITEYLWTYSVIQESIAILPQLVLLTRTGDRTVLNTNYLLALGCYRALYILNWLYRWAVDGYTDGTALLFGTIQTILYIDFVIVYRSRQQISFDGSVVTRDDAETRGILLKYILRSKTLCPERDESGRPLHVPLGGYSVSANLPPTTRDPYRFSPSPVNAKTTVDPKQNIISPMNTSPKRPSPAKHGAAPPSDVDDAVHFTFQESEAVDGDDDATDEQEQEKKMLRSASPKRGVL